MGGQNGGEKTPEERAKEAELADMLARVGQIARGQRTEFEKALLSGLRTTLTKEVWPWAHDDRPLTANEGEALARMFKTNAELYLRAKGAFALYNDMRAVLGVMLDKLPEMPDQRFAAAKDMPALPDALKNVKK